METCPWCEVGKLQLVTDTVFWELPDGTRAVEIDETPSFFVIIVRLYFKVMKRQKRLKISCF